MRHLRQQSVDCIQGPATAFVLLLLFFGGCTTTPKIPEDALRLQESSLEIRQIQSRNFEVPSEIEILTASVAVLQDMEYNIDRIEKPLGVLTASKTVDADSASEKAGLIILDVACAVGSVMGGSVGTCNAMSTASDEQNIMLTLVILPSLARKGEFVARITLDRVVFDKQGRVKLQEAINDPEAYQQIFENLSKSIFLQINE